jgi:hypothetical protein
MFDWSNRSLAGKMPKRNDAGQLPEKSLLYGTGMRNSANAANAEGAFKSAFSDAVIPKELHTGGQYLTITMRAKRIRSRWICELFLSKHLNRSRQN